MSFPTNHYDVIGVSIVEELYKQAEEAYPISDEPLPSKPSWFQRVVRGLMGRSTEVAQHSVRCNEADELRGSA